jgi:hypothetical protein
VVVSGADKGHTSGDRLPTFIEAATAEHRSSSATSPRQAGLPWL